MKKIKKINKIISLICVLLLSFNFLTVISVAGGTGTEEDPFIIKTAGELQNINNNVTAHYILGNDIDLADMEFIPIGNADSGAFSGSFDGNGYKILNLNVFFGKYAGLFGSNEGTIKNVTLENIYVYGTRYIGGVVAQNTSCGTIENCSVLSGTVETDGGLYNIHMGGVCGSNSGTVVGTFFNGAAVKGSSSDVSIYAGGICGYWNSSITDELKNLCNTGNVSSSSSYSYSYSGGLVGYANSTVNISSSYNTGNVSSSSSSFSSYSGGLVGYANSTVTIKSSYNTGNVSSSYYYSGGIVGYANSTVTIVSSYNTGNVFSSSYSGGLVGYAYRTVTIVSSYNTGNVSSSSLYSYSGGLVGYADSAVNISSSYNTGNVSSSSSSSSRYSYSGGLVGYVRDTVTISSSYNTGNVSSSDYSGGLVGAANSTVNISSSYSLKGCRANGSGGYFGTVLGSEKMKTQSSYIDWDFGEIWFMPGSSNSGYPVLKTVSSPLTLNCANGFLTAGSTIQLTAYKNGVATSAVTWSVTKGGSVVSSKGLVTASVGLSTITATDSEGNKANFNMYGFTAATSVTATKRVVNLTESSSDNKSYFEIIGSTTDYIVDYQSSDTSVVKISALGFLTPVSVGTATITATTLGGISAKQSVTVTAVAKSLDLPSSLTVNCGSIKKITATTNPNPTTSVITWTSSDESVATVDSEGNVTGLKSGTTIITATTDNGYSDTCTVIVNAPITEISFDTPSLTLYTGETFKLKLNITPTNTTDSITYSSSSTTKATVSSTGLVTAKSTGTVTITATSSSGQKAYCNITIKSWPSVLTTVDSTTTVSQRYIITDTTSATKISSLVVAKEGYTVNATPSLSAGGKNYYGTGSTVSVYDEYENLLITYTLVVNGDLNGDSVCDVLDAAQIANASSGLNDLTGVYAKAADSNSDDKIDANDYQTIVNKAIS